MPHSNVSSQDWFYHSQARQKQTSGPVEQTSQIPGLCQFAEDNNAAGDNDQSKRKWIRDTDSKYVRLAKAGGRKDLFQYREHRPSENGPQPYPRVDWFDHIQGQPDYNEEDITNSSKPLHPDWYRHDDSLVGDQNVKDVANHSEQETPFLAFDNLSIWKRDEAANKSGSKIKGKKMQEKKDFTPFVRRQPEKEDLQHLLSMGYQRDWLNEREKQIKQVAEDTKKQQKEKATRRAKETVAANTTPRKGTTEQEEKPLFKMTRFTNISPKVNSFRSPEKSP